MILPEDTKVPLHPEDQDSDAEVDFYEPGYTPYPTHPTPHHAQYTPYQSYDSPPYTPSTHPLLQAQEDDIELGPAPPYSAEYDPPTVTSFRRAPSEKRRSRFVAIRRAALWVGLGVVVTMPWLIWMGPVGGRRGWRGGRGRRPGWGLDGIYDGQESDGVPVICQNYTAKGWTRYPSDMSVSGEEVSVDGMLGQREGQDGVSRWSQNTTITVPTNEPGELFAHLSGYAGVGDFFIDTYDSADEALFKDDQHGISDKAPLKGEYVKVKVEPIVTLREKEEMEGSEGLRLLQAAKVCLMDRGRKADERPGPPGPAHEGHSPEGRGVGVYTRKLDDSPTGRPIPLQFRIHIALPSTLASSPSFTQSLFDVLSGPKPHHPKGFVRELNVRGEVGGIYAGNLTQSGLGELDLKLEAGEIVIDDVRVENLRMKTETGKIKARVAVANSIDVDTPSGEINLDLTVATPPSFALPPPFPIRGNSTGDGFDVCSLPPVRVNARTVSGTVKVNYTGWEAECRTLSQDVGSVVGAAEVHAHPLYQGPYRVTSELGSIAVDIPSQTADPTGRGRVRDITLEKNGRLGSQVWEGEVTWRDSDESSEVLPEEDDLFSRGTARRSKQKAKLDVRTSLGSAKLFF